MAAAYYCYECLRKPKGRDVKLSEGVCPSCHSEYRKVKNNKTRSQVVTRLARHRGIKPHRKRKRTTTYNEYLLTYKWRVIRTRIIDRDDNVCQNCGNPSTEVHHMSYQPSVMEGKDDSKLISLCRDCHTHLHDHLKTRFPEMRVGESVQHTCHVWGDLFGCEFQLPRKVTKAKPQITKKPKRKRSKKIGAVKGHKQPHGQDSARGRDKSQEKHRLAALMATLPKPQKSNVPLAPSVHPILRPTRRYCGALTKQVCNIKQKDPLEESKSKAMKQTCCLTRQRRKADKSSV